MRVTSDQERGEHFSQLATWEAVPWYKYGDASLTGNPTVEQEKDQSHVFRSGEDHPPRQAPVSYRLYLFPQGFLCQAHSSKEWLLQGYFSAEFKTRQQWSMGLKDFLKRNPRLGGGNQSMAHRVFQLCTSRMRWHSTMYWEAERTMEREKMGLSLQTAHTWLEFFCPEREHL